MHILIKNILNSPELVNEILAHYQKENKETISENPDQYLELLEECVQYLPSINEQTVKLLQAFNLNLESFIIKNQKTTKEGLKQLVFNKLNLINKNLIDDESFILNLLNHPSLNAEIFWLYFDILEHLNKKEKELWFITFLSSNQKVYEKYQKLKNEELVPTVEQTEVIKQLIKLIYQEKNYDLNTIHDLLLKINFNNIQNVTPIILDIFNNFDYSQKALLKNLSNDWYDDLVKHTKTSNQVLKRILILYKNQKGSWYSKILQHVLSHPNASEEVKISARERAIHYQHAVYQDRLKVLLVFKRKCKVNYI